MWLVGKHNTKITMPNGQTEIRNEGDACPEADSWRNPKRWEGSGFIRWIPQQLVTKELQKAHDDAKKRGAKGKRKAATKGAQAAPEHTEESLAGLKLGELQKLADGLSAEPQPKKGKKPTKDDFVAAILKAQAEAKAAA